MIATIEANSQNSENQGCDVCDVSSQGTKTPDSIPEVPDKSLYRSLEDVTSLDELNTESDCDVPPLSPRLRTESNLSSGPDFLESYQTLIFLDWDDTLFPTTQLFDVWGLPSRYEAWDQLSLSAEQEHLLDRWCSALHIYLKTVCSVADRCVILTNSTRPWVSNCIDRFAPKLKSMFDRCMALKIVYAREHLANQRRASMTPAMTVHKEVLQEELQEQLMKAKLAAMQHEAKKFYSQYPGQSWKNILSVGDSKYEHDAAVELAFRRKAPKQEHLRLKTIVTPSDPSIRDLTYLLGLAQLYRAYVTFDGDFDIDTASPKQLHAIAEVLGMPELDNHIREFPISEEDETTLAEEFEEVDLLVCDRMARQISEASTAIPTSPCNKCGQMEDLAAGLGRVTE